MLYAAPVDCAYLDIMEEKIEEFNIRNTSRINDLNKRHKTEMKQMEMQLKDREIKEEEMMKQLEEMSIRMKGMMVKARKDTIEMKEKEKTYEKEIEALHFLNQKEVQDLKREISIQRDLMKKQRGDIELAK